MQRRRFLPVLNKLCFCCKHEKRTDGIVVDVSVNRRERRIGCQSANKQVGNGFNQFSTTVFTCAPLCLSVCFRNCQLNEQAVRILEGERTRRTWVKVVSMATAALKALSPCCTHFTFLPAAMVATPRRRKRFPAKS